MTPNHLKFQSHLTQSKDSVWLAARWLNDMGYAVKLNPTSVAPTAKDWKAHKDNGDLEIAMRVEVKGLSCNFTSREDWPYGDRVIVCAAHAWDGANPKPYAVVQLNKDRTHALIISRDSKPNWYLGTIKDRRYGDGYSQQAYLVPLEYVVFAKITKE